MCWGQFFFPVKDRPVRHQPPPPFHSRPQNFTLRFPVSVTSPCPKVGPHADVEAQMDRLIDGLAAAFPAGPRIPLQEAMGRCRGRSAWGGNAGSGLFTFCVFLTEARYVCRRLFEPEDPRWVSGSWLDSPQGGCGPETRVWVSPSSKCVSGLIVGVPPSSHLGGGSIDDFLCFRH